LTHTTFWLESQLWGVRPAGYHAVNVLLHGASAVLLWRVLRRLGVPGALAAAAIFALHPVHVESVAWISERKNVLSGFIYLAAALTYLRFAGIGPPDDPPDEQKRPKWPLYAAALALYACAVFSKTVTTSLPAALLLVLWWKRRLDRRQALLLLPMFAFALVMGRVTAGMEAWNVGAAGRHWNWSIVERCLIAGRAMWFYAGKLAWPHPLIFTYPRWQIDAHQAWQYAFPAAAALTVISLWLVRNHIGRGPLVVVLFFCGTLFPALGFVNVYPMRFSYVADHFQYLASIGLIALAVATVTLTLQRRVVPGAARTSGLVLSGAVVVVLGVLTFRQSRVYHDAETLWSDTIAKNERAWLAHTNLAAALQARGEEAGAARHYARSLEIEPDQVHTHLFWGALLERQGDAKTAEAHYLAAGEIEPQDVRPPHALGRLAAARGDIPTAIARYAQALALDDRFERARLDLASLLLAQGRTADAFAQLQTTLEKNPYSLEAMKKLAGILFRNGHPAEAIGYLTRARELGDDSPPTTSNIGVMLMQSGRPAEAAEQFRKAIARDPSFAEAHYNLGNALKTLGDYAGAERAYREALRLKPDFVPAQEELKRMTGA
jgi:tetratricopeptide (TPR) repeat protein